MTSKTTNKSSAEVRTRAVRLVLDRETELFLTGEPTATCERESI